MAMQRGHDRHRGEHDGERRGPGPGGDGGVLRPAHAERGHAAHQQGDAGHEHRPAPAGDDERGGDHDGQGDPGQRARRVEQPVVAVGRPPASPSTVKGTPPLHSTGRPSDRPATTEGSLPMKWMRWSCQA